MEKSEDLIPETGTATVSDADWAELRRIAEVIAPLASLRQVPNSLAEDAGEQLGVTGRTIYNLLRRWRASGESLVSLGRRSSGGKGKSRVPQHVDKIISDVIATHYLTRQRISIAAVTAIIRSECKAVGLTPPSVNTVRARIARLRPEDVVQRRHGKDAARRLKEVKGQHPPVSLPLDAVQIDHTRVDLIVVDSFTRQPIGRPCITVAIDVYSRCIIGFYLTFEAPSAVSVGLCLAHAVMDKKPWLERIGVQADWPMSGKPKVIHVDNGSDFRSEALRRGCEAHGIRIIYRPVGAPHYGGVIERLIGTLMTMVHQLPGTTFSNVASRGEYRSEHEAAMTLAELEKWFALAIVGPYHGALHSGIGQSPFARWKEGMIHMPSTSLVTNSKAFLVDFLPIIRRRIQRQGFVVDHIVYFNASLRPWIGQRDRKHRFIIRRDPRDLSRIFVLHPNEEHYLEVPYRTMYHPAITLWEHRRAIERMRERGRETIDEEGIFKAVQEMRAVTDNAVKMKKSARRAMARRAHLDAHPKVQHAGPPTDVTVLTGDAKPFDDIEFW